MYGGVLSVGALAIVVASAVLLRDFTRDVMNRVFKNNSCHNFVKFRFNGLTLDYI